MKLIRAIMLLMFGLWVPGTAFAALLFLGGYKDLVVGSGLPPNGNMINVKAYGATGNGVTDDTAACNAAIAALPAYSTSLDQLLRIIYWPNGTYLLSGTCTRLPNQPQAANVVMIGESQAGVHIKLANSTTGFTSAGTPKPIFQLNSGNIFSQSPSPSTGEGNEGFNNTVENMTFDLGSGNAGAVAIDTVVNNIGVYRNITINTTGAAYAGMLMNRRYNGPSLTSNVTINGPVQYGIRVGWSELAPVFEHVVINGATAVGIRNTQNSVTMRSVHITMNGGIGFQQVDSGDGQFVTPWGPNEGLTTAIDLLVDGTGTNDILVSNGAQNFQNVRSVGFNGGGTVSYDGVYQNGVKLANPGWSLTIKETPTFSTAGTTQWTQIITSQAPNDATADIQAALNANPAQTVFYLPTGHYRISSSITVPDNVSRIECLYSTIDSVSGVNYSMFVTNPTRTTDLYIRRCIINNLGPINAFVDWKSPPPARLIVTDYSGPEVVLQEATAGEFYGENINATHIELYSTVAGSWLRQFDPETGGTKTTVINSNVWILGLKTEQVGVLINNNGGNIEAVGSLTYPGAQASSPMFISTNNGRIVVSHVTDELAANLGWATVMTSTINSINNTIPTSSYFQRGPFNGRTIAQIDTDNFIPTIQSSKGVLVSVLASATVGTAVTTASLSTDYATTGTAVWSLSVSAGGKYAINSSTGAITVNAALSAGTDNISVHVTGLTIGATGSPVIADLAIALNVRTSFSSQDPANTASNLTLSNGNLTVTANTANSAGNISRGLGNHSSGVYYAEYTYVSGGSFGCGVGLVNSSQVVTNSHQLGETGNNSIGYFFGGGSIFLNGTHIDTGAALANGDILGMLTDENAHTVSWYKNNVLQTTDSTSAITAPLYPAVECDGLNNSVTAGYGPSYTYSHIAGDW